MRVDSTYRKRRFSALLILITTSLLFAALLWNPLRSSGADAGGSSTPASQYAAQDGVEVGHSAYDARTLGRPHVIHCGFRFRGCTLLTE